MNNHKHNKGDFVANEKTDTNYANRIEKIQQQDDIDAKFGYERVNDTVKRTAWLVNFQASETVDSLTKKIVAAVDFYFLQPNGKRFKVAFPYKPYLYLGVVPDTEFIVSAYLTRKYDSITVQHVEKEDLDLKNHLAGLKSKFLKVLFPSTVEMTVFKHDLMKQIRKNKDNFKNTTDYTSILAKNMGCDMKTQFDEPKEQIIEIREYDIPYHMRCCIDQRIFAGLWYDVLPIDPNVRAPTITRNTELVEPYDPVVCAYDIETTKLPLKFPDAEIDQIMMISYMIDGRGFLIINRQVVSADIDDFEFSPKPEFPGHFIVYNEVNERATISKFFDHLLRAKPSIITTYNGDFFDWPFVEARAKLYGMDMAKIIGFSKNSEDEYQSACCAHLDAYRWVVRDSYLSMGSQNLKAATRAKLRYDPVELDPELMLDMAKNQPQVLANYSVSDAVSTYYLYQKYVHPFIFALCTIIPLGPDDVLRKGSGTLCEALLMVEAYHKDIIFPNKQIERDHQFTVDGHLINSETYVGARVESLESGVFRSDIPVKFRLDVERLQALKDDVPETMKHTLTSEMGVAFNEIVNFDEICEQVRVGIAELILNPQRHENPKIYHLDVGAMYPNIILTNRLQPPAVVTDEQCLACVHNTPDAKCKREMEWTWRAEFHPASKGEYERIRHRLEEERFGKPPKAFNQLSRDEKSRLEKKRLNEYCRVAYGKLNITREEKKSARICQKENSFYVNTVLAFRDRRYEYKAMLKKAKNELSTVDSKDLAGVKAGHARVVLYESLQLAHKCILNSFYGYVMRKGSRWFSMEMAGIICHTGSMIISEACELVEKIGRPLELDTDGIWCLLPATFPESFAFTLQNGKKVSISYPGAMLNALVKDRFTNDQYHVEREDGTYDIKSENSIFFEVDGPYLAMILPASKEAGKKLKKRYVVFNEDGSLAELKGFELKRRGELGIIKQFQSEVFKDFLKGTNLKEIYDHVAKEANYWLDILMSKGKSLPDEELFELIAENRNMSKKLEDYGAQKSTSITTARRLAEFLGDEMVRNAGLATTFIVSKEPRGSPVTDRTIPVAIFQSDKKLRTHFLRKWTKNPNVDSETDVRELIDWDYYSERLQSCIQKIITLPAALQGIENPVPRVKHPDWLEAEKRKKLDMTLQPRINEFFKKKIGTTPRSTPRSAQKRSQSMALVGATPKRSCPDRLPDPPLQRKTFGRDGFREWLKYLKEKWGRQRKAHMKAMALARNSSSNAPSNRNMTTMQKMMAASTERIRAHPFHLLQIVETSTPGVYTAFAVSEGVMRCFELIVQRTFYVDDAFERATTHGRTVQKTLPRLRPSAHLYEYTVDEKKFVDKVSSFNEQLCKMNINGIYETQVPLQFQTILKLGATSNVKTLISSTRINLDQMKRVSHNEMPFVSMSVFQILYFYEFTVDNRTAFALFNPTSGQAHLFIINRAEVEVTNMNTVYKKEYAKYIEKYGEGRLFKGSEKITVSFAHVKSIKDGARQLQNVLKALKWSPVDPVLCCVQSPKIDSTLRKEFPALAQYPIVRIAANDPTSMLTGLDWWTSTCKRMIQHYLNSYTILSDYWTISEYIGIPPGNLPEDTATLALDVLYARALQYQDYILWASPSDRPDFGGKELVDWHLDSNWESVSFRSALSHVYDEEMFEARNFCVEFDLGALAVTALMQSAAIAEAEGTSEYVGFAAEQSHMTIDAATHVVRKEAMADFNEAFSISGALRVLRGLCTSLIRDIKPGENSFANHLIIALYRWIRSPNSLLYDPAVEQAVFTMMRKLCLLLVTELNQLGARVAHCSFSKVVICTGRSNLQAARAFVETLRSSLRRKKLFSSLNLVPIRYTRLMVWINAFNKAYVRVFDPLTDTLIEDNNKAQVEMQLANILLVGGDCRRVFNSIILYYLNLLSKKAREDKVSEEDFVQFSVDKFREVMAPKIFEIIDSLKNNYAQVKQAMEQEKNPVLKAYNLDKHANVPLQFIKCCFKVFGIYTPIQEAVVDIRYQALLMINKDEFSQETVWKPPQVSVILEQMFCPNCLLNIDLDVCAQKHPESEHDEPFLCPSCSRALSKLLIEELLMERAKKMQIAYRLQDVKCSKCKQIGNRVLRSNCQFCYGSYVNTITLEEYRTNLEVLADISDAYMLENLAFVVTELLKSIQV